MTSKDLRAIKLGAAALGSVALLWLVVLPMLSNWSDTRDHIERSRQRLEELQDRTRRLTALDRQLEPVLGESVKHPMPGVEAARTQLIKDLMDVHARAGSGIQSLQPQSPRPLRELPGVVRLAVQVQTACLPAQLIQLLAAARSSPSILLIDHIEAASPAGPPGMPPGMQGPPGMTPLTVTIVWSTLARQEESQ